MKKFLLIATVAGVALAGCAKNERFDDADSQSKIRFTDPVMALPTKALIEDTDFPTNQGSFIVTGWHVSEGEFNPDASTTPTLYMDKAEATYTGTADTSGDEDATGSWQVDYYWPKTGSLTFSALYPKSALSDNVKFNVLEGFEIPNYTIADAAAAQVDLLYTNRVYNQTSSNVGGQGKYDGVSLAFKHALSAIQFKAKAATDADKNIYTIKSIDILAATKTGTFVEGLETGVEIEDKSKWIFDTEPSKANYSYFSGNYIVSETAPTATVNASPALMLIPQTLTDEMKVKVVFNQKRSATGNEVSVDQTLELSLKTDSLSEWGKGTRYTYTLVFSAQKIYFEPSVTTWSDSSAEIQ